MASSRRGSFITGPVGNGSWRHLLRFCSAVFSTEFSPLHQTSTSDTEEIAAHCHELSALGIISLSTRETGSGFVVRRVLIGPLPLTEVAAFRVDLFVVSFTRERQGEHRALSGDGGGSAFSAHSAGAAP